MQKPKDFVRIRHVADPGIPGGISEAVPEAGDHEDDDEDGIRGVHGDYNVGDEMASWSYDGDAALAEFEVDRVVEERRGGVAREGGEED